MKTMPRKAWNTLALRHLNVDEVQLTARHVPAENLVFWMSNPDTEATSVRNSNLVLKQKIPLEGRPDTMTTSHVNVASKIPASTKDRPHCPSRNRRSLRRSRPDSRACTSRLQCLH